jgi:hypothetical protein
MSKNSARKNYFSLLEWLKVRGYQTKPKITVYKN